MNLPQDCAFNLTGNRKFLSECSFDIIILIQQFLAPLDILALRLTCKSISEATRARSVWVNAVYKVCIAHGAFLPSFPLKEMSVNDLEHTALSPRRFRAIIEKYNGQSTKPLLTRTFVPRIQPRPLDGPATQTEIYRMVLIPGGRFLLTSTYSGDLFLWDLGFNAGLHMKLFPIATLKVNEGFRGFSNSDNFWFECGPMVNSGGIYIVTESASTEGVDVDVVCYEIYPNSEFPNFQQIGAVATPGPMSDCSALSLDYYACWQEGLSFMVWNFTADLGICWNFADPPYMIHTAGENIITFHTERYLLWKLPDLQPLGNGLPPHIDHSAKLTFGYPFVAEGIYNEVSLPSCWLPQAAQEHLLIFKCGANPAMMHFAIKSIDTSHDASLPGILPLHVGSVQGGPNSPQVQDLIVTDTGFLQTWQSGDKKKILTDLIFMPMPENPAYSSVSAILWSRDQSLGNMKDYDICSMTGRMVIKLYNDIDGGDSHTELHVMDFLLPRAFL